MTILRVEHLFRSYPEQDRNTPVLQNLSLSLQPGERIAILGRSGCGKSTLLNAIAGLDPPDSGRILVAGYPMTGCSEKQRTLLRRRRIGFIFQFFNLIPTLSVRENVLLPLELLGSRAAQSRLHELLESLQISHLQNEFPERLSGGEQQRVAMARALIHAPELILADEPTGNLDLQTGNLVARYLFDIVDEHRAMIVVTHSPEIANRADRIYELHEGQLRPFQLPVDTDA